MLKSKFRIYIIAILLIICLAWISRNIIFNTVFEKIITKTENRLGFDIAYHKAKLIGLRTVVITKLHIASKDRKPILASDSIVIAIKPLNLIIGRIRLQSLSIYKTQVWMSYDWIKSFSQRSKNEADTTQLAKSADYGNLINSIQQRVFGYLPKHIIFRSLSFYYETPGAIAVIRVENFNYENEHYLGELLFMDNQLSNRCIAEGSIDPSARTFSCMLSHTDSASLRLPYLGPRLQASFGFDTLQFTCKFDEEADKNTRITGKIKTNNLAIFHTRISPDTVQTKFAEMDYIIRVGKRFIELDSSSIVMLNRFKFSPYIKFQRDTSSKITVAFIKNEFEAQDFFKSLPSGLFNNFDSMQTKGNLEYQMRLSLDWGNPDSVLFYSNLQNKGFSITKYGVTDFRIMNSSFYHEVYDYGQLISRFQVGPENFDFVYLNDISPFLRYSILTSEDGDFFYHKGFNLNAFRESIAKNIKEKRFARGGSTISMQLIKNVFLSRKKTISRKIEEALIVWMIENQQLVSKERMFEVYLNIIEWGPGIYGIKPAAWFYFKKQPNELSLSESIYLTSIIPRPKSFRYMFDKDGKLRDFLNPYYKLLSGIMVRRNQILPEDTVNLKPIKGLSGEARKFLEKPDSTIIEDSLFFIQPMEIGPIGNFGD